MFKSYKGEGVQWGRCGQGFPCQRSPTFPAYSIVGTGGPPQQLGEGRGAASSPLSPARAFLFLFGFIEKKE